MVERDTSESSGSARRERRDPSRQRGIAGGRRQADPPLTTRDCADWMGVTTNYIRGEIADGRLEAEVIPTGRRRIIRIHPHLFFAYLRRRGWKHLPKVSLDPA